MIAYGLQLYSGKRPRQKRIMSFNPAFTPSWSDVERYKRLRSLGKDLNHRMVQTIPRETPYAVGEAIGILHKGVLVFQAKTRPGCSWIVVFTTGHLRARAACNGMPKPTL
jgi:hypothetical protein